MLRAEVLETMLYAGCVTWSPRAYLYDMLREPPTASRLAASVHEATTLRYSYMRPDSHTQLPKKRLRPLFFPPFSLEMPPFPSIMYHNASFLYGEYVV